MVCRYFIADRLLALAPRASAPLRAEGLAVASASRYRVLWPIEHADCWTIVARRPQHAASFDPRAAKVKFLSTPETFALSQRGFGDDKEGTRGDAPHATRFACRSDGCAHRCREIAKSPWNCGEGAMLRKIPVASVSGDAMFAPSIFQPIRVWGVGRLR